MTSGSGGRVTTRSKITSSSLSLAAETRDVDAMGASPVTTVESAAAIVVA